MVVKVTVNLPARSVADLRALAAKRGCTMTAVLADGIGSLRFFEDVEERGGKVLIEALDGTTRQVVFVR